MIRPGLVLGGLGLFVGMAALLIAKTTEESALRQDIAVQAACLTAVAGTDAEASAEACPVPVAAQHRTARRSVRCDQALLKADLFAIEAACSAEVKTLLAERQAENRRADRLDELLDQTRADQAAAIARAEARTRSQSQRATNAQAAVSSAPRDPDGLVRCDAECLRQRTSDRP